MMLLMRHYAMPLRRHAMITIRYIIERLCALNMPCRLMTRDYRCAIWFILIIDATLYYYALPITFDAPCRHDICHFVNISP